MQAATKSAAITEKHSMQVMFSVCSYICVCITLNWMTNLAYESQRGPFESPAWPGHWPGCGAGLSVAARASSRLMVQASWIIKTFYPSTSSFTDRVWTSKQVCIFQSPFVRCWCRYFVPESLLLASVNISNSTCRRTYWFRLCSSMRALASVKGLFKTLNNKHQTTSFCVMRHSLQL